MTATDRCQRCGRPRTAKSGGCECQVVEATPVYRSTRSRGGDHARSVLDSRFVVCVLLFVVTGALGLPLLWMSRAFGPLTKVWLSVVVIVYTAALIALTYYSCVIGWRELREFFYH